MDQQTDKKKAKKPLTPRQSEIKRLTDKGRDKRSDQENARLDQLKKEERRERFVKLFPARVQKVIDALETLSNCAATNSYEYTQEEIDKAVKAINERLAATVGAFSHRKEERKLFAL